MNNAGVAAAAGSPVPLRDHIFISYRRDDARGASGRLYDWLRIGFGRDRVFRDVHSIGVGKWREKIDRALERCAVCVAVIGPRWANAENLPRLHEKADMVRHELVSALDCGEITLVPTLVEGALARDVPLAKLPAVMAPLFDWNVLEVTEGGWEDDTRRLIGHIAAASGLRVGPDLDTLLRDAGAAQERIQELEEARNLQTGQMEALRRSVDELRGKLAEASGTERSGLAAAFAELARGDSAAAEDAFEREYDRQDRAAVEARRNMAESARNVANLALLRDVTKAVEFYRRALVSEPSHAETARLLGEALILLGKLEEARRAFLDSLRMAQAASEVWGEMWAQIGLGDVDYAMGNLAAAETAYLAARQVAEKRVAEDPASSQWQRELSVGHNRLGDVLVAQGDGPGALRAYRAGLGIAEELAARDPANSGWQRDLSVSHDRIGNVMVAQGDVPGALRAYRAGLDIREELAARDPANSEWQRDLSVSHNKIGDVMVAQGDGPGALGAYRAGLGIAEELAMRDPANALWQTDVAVSCSKLGVLSHGQTVEERSSYLQRGRHLLVGLKSEGRLLPSQDWIAWFDRQLAGLV